MTNQTHTDIALEAALEAAVTIMRHYREGFGIEQKADASPVTDADKAADAIIRRHLEATGIPVISEESVAATYAERKNWNRVWIVDPLDGTKEFIKHTGEFTVNIALVEEGTPTEGLVFAPAMGLLYRTERGVLHRETYRLGEKMTFEKTGGKVLPARAEESPNICASVSHADTTTRRYVERYGRAHPMGKLIAVGSSLKFGLLAEGQAGIYPRFSPTMEWDTAAGQAILTAAGGQVWDLETRRPVRYNRENLLNGAFIALGPHVSTEEAFSLL